MAAAPEMIEVRKHLFCPCDVARGALNLDAVRFQINADVQSLLQDLQVFVTSTKKFLNVGNDFNIFLHSALAVFLPNPMVRRSQTRMVQNDLMRTGFLLMAGEA